MFESWGARSGRGHGERVEREPITEVWGRSPQRGLGAEPLVGGQGGFAPPLKLKAFRFLNVPRSGKTLYRCTRCLSRFDSVKHRSAEGSTFGGARAMACSPMPKVGGAAAPSAALVPTPMWKAVQFHSFRRAASKHLKSPKNVRGCYECHLIITKTA